MVESKRVILRATGPEWTASVAALTNAFALAIDELHQRHERFTFPRESRISPAVMAAMFGMIHS
jgi:hypothetical protein